jgi:hypothetical protein
MKKLIPFLLTLTTFLANAQYNRIHTAYPHNSLALNRPTSSTLYMTAGSRSLQSLPYFLRTPAVGTLSSLTNLNDPLEQPRPSPTHQSPIQGVWLKPWTPPSVGNGRFKSNHSFDMQHNVSDSKATYQFTKRRQ